MGYPHPNFCLCAFLGAYTSPGVPFMACRGSFTQGSFHVFFFLRNRVPEGFSHRAEGSRFGWV